jgi:hypothetical protein
MQFLRRHFEKIILSAVLAGLGAAAFWLSVAVSKAKDAAPPATAVSPRSKEKAGVESNVAEFRSALKALKEAPDFVLTGEHNLFNPVTWKMRPGGRPFKMKVGGAAALSVAEIRPYYFTITYEGPADVGFYLTAQHAPGFGPKAKKQFAVTNEKPTELKPYTIVGTNAAPEDPSTPRLQLLIPETGGKVWVTTKEPYKRVEGHEADMKYSGSDNTNLFPKKHVGDSLPVSGEQFKIIAITNDAVRVQDGTTKQMTEIRWKEGSDKP